MKKSRRAKKSPKSRKRNNLNLPSGSILDYHTELLHMKRNLQRLAESSAKAEERLQDMEIHVNLLTRLLTALCVEKLGIRVGVLKRLIKRIESEAIRDSQILHLEELYKLPPASDKKNSASPPPAKNDPWEDIS